ncbi:MAG: DNA-binding response regulator, partial [Paramuribaculum sp.]|nr:DNA-binding response regulator [Paramuribaculum sp.]
IKAGAAEFVVKPWDNNELLDTLLRVSQPRTDAPIQIQKPVQSAETSSLADMERDSIEQAIISERGNMTRVANRLGISRQTLYNKIKRYGL